MDKLDYRKNAELMIYLVSCAVNGKTPDAEKVQNIDLKQLFQVCQSHSLTAAAAYALESVGIKDHEFTQAKEKAIRKNILLDAERTKILNALETEHIWHMPLKGALMKDWYPKLGMRQMADNDILYNPESRSKVKEIMLTSGFTLDKSSKNADEYSKKPVHYFEMHISLFSEYKEKIYHYYTNIKEKLVKDEHHDYGYHFPNEDFYIYMIAHEYKHYKSGGTGVRSLLDLYVFMKKFSDSIDMSYIETELKKMDIAEFEKQSRILAIKLFGSGLLTADEQSLLDYYIFSGAYGTFDNIGKNKIEKDMQGNGKIAKLNYIFYRLFPPMTLIQSEYPFFYKHKYLIPVLWITRPFVKMITNKNKIKSEIKYLFLHK